LIYPLAHRGERFPFVRPDARPFEVGEFVDDGDRYAAALQGVAFVERLCFAVLGRLGADLSGPVSMTGGATRSRYWTQLRADTLGRSVVLPAHSESAVGAAIVAAAGTGPLAATAAEMSPPGRTIEPRPESSERLLGAYRRFVEALAERGYIDPALADHARAAS
jgi:sugar (pentulose or hexulose) kinase